jgi:hypothetical protein
VRLYRAEPMGGWGEGGGIRSTTGGARSPGRNRSSAPSPSGVLQEPKVPPGPKVRGRVTGSVVRLGGRSPPEGTGPPPSLDPDVWGAPAEGEGEGGGICSTTGESLPWKEPVLRPLSTRVPRELGAPRARGGREGGRGRRDP